MIYAPSQPRPGPPPLLCCRTLRRGTKHSSTLYLERSSDAARAFCVNVSYCFGLGFFFIRKHKMRISFLQAICYYSTNLRTDGNRQSNAQPLHITDWCHSHIWRVWCKCVRSCVKIWCLHVSIKVITEIWNCKNIPLKAGPHPGFWTSKCNQNNTVFCIAERAPVKRLSGCFNVQTQWIYSVSYYVSHRETPPGKVRNYKAE